MEVFTERYLVERYGEEVAEKEMGLFRTVRSMVENFNPDKELSRKVSCHILVDALTPLFPDLKPQHGYWRPGWTHAWFRTPLDNIIDVYPWGTIGGPVMISCEVIPNLPTYDIRGNVDGFHQFFSPDKRVLAGVKENNPDYDGLVEQVRVALK